MSQPWGIEARRRTTSVPSKPNRWPFILLKWSLIALAINVVVRIVVEYAMYFPVNFDAVFLVGRQEYFHGIYKYAFYPHIIAGPIALALMAFLVFSGRRKAWMRAHRIAGRVQIGLLLLVLAPTGLVMSFYAFTGPIAGIAFGLQSIALAIFAWMTFHYARARRMDKHIRWATRCNILLCSPLILRLYSGVMIVCDWETDGSYQASAWLSWIVPLAIYECRLWRKRHLRKTGSTRQMHFSV